MRVEKRNPSQSHLFGDLYKYHPHNSTTFATLLPLEMVIQAPDYPPFPPGRGLRWEPIWEMTDQFWREGLYHIWEPFHTKWLGRKPSFFRPSNVTVDNVRKCLRLNARHDQPWHVHDTRLRNALLRSNQATEARNRERAPDEREDFYRDYSTSIVRSKHLQQYGYFEIKCKLADSDISSAFWLANDEPARPSGSWWTELDVFEYSTSTKNGKDQSRLINSNHHVHRFGNDPERPRRSAANEYDTGVNLSQGIHTFALDWTPQYVRWYFNGKLIRQIKNDYYHRPLRLKIDRETFPGWFGLPRGNELPNTFDIYYVRSWQRVRA